MALSPLAQKMQLPPARAFPAPDDLSLNDDEKMVRDSARQFAKSELLGRIRAWDEGNLAPYAKGEDLTRDIARKIAGALNLFGATLPEMGKYVGESDFVLMSPAAYGAAK